jgi:tRNA(Ile)-lysidine synthase
MKPVEPDGLPNMSAPSLTDEGLQDLFDSLSSATAILAAVSGGPDSMALMHLLARWAGPGRPPVLVATVDHGLRPEAAEEAAWVGREAARLGLSHETLVWTGPKPGTGLQAAARKARYALLADHARRQGASHLVTAHTLDDQAETVLMRMAHGSGLAGLSGMRPERDLAGIRHARPLLDFPKASLLALSAAHGWEHRTDPSNANARYERVRWRALMPALAREGLSAERLSVLAARAARAEAALAAKAGETLAAAKTFEGNTFEATCLLAEPFDIALRVLDLALARAVTPDRKRLHRLESCLERLREALGNGAPLHLTVAGAVLRLDRSGRLSIAPEPPRRRGR